MTPTQNRHIAIERAISAARKERAEFIGRISAAGFAKLQGLLRHGAEGRKENSGEAAAYRLGPATANCR